MKPIDSIEEFASSKFSYPWDSLKPGKGFLLSPSEFSTEPAVRACARQAARSRGWKISVHRQPDGSLAVIRHQ